MFSLHTHDGRSNASRGFADSSIKLEDMVKRAKAIGLNGIAITNHESVGSFIEAKNLEEKYDFPVICGNEIYLVNDQQDTLLRENYNHGMYYPHFLLVALDEIGNQQLRELSTKAWINSYMQKGLIRTTTTMYDIEEVVIDNPGHIIAADACLGGQMAKWIVDIYNNKENVERIKLREKQIKRFVKWCIDTFGEGNFYLECQPGTDEQLEQIFVNNYKLKLSKKLKVPCIITSDAHYLSKELLDLHTSFLMSSNIRDDEDVEDVEGGEFNKNKIREEEIKQIYKTAYLMNEEEIIEYFKPHWDIKDIKEAIKNTDIIGERAKKYQLKHKQIIPKIKLDKGWKITPNFFPNKEYINKMVKSPYEQDRYLMYLIEKGIKKLIPSEEYEETFKRVELEVTEFWEVSEQLKDRLGGYFVTIAKIVELMWTEGDSLVGVGRGSGVSSIINYLLEVTQINPLKMPVEMPFFRFVNRARIELADIDIDTQSNRRKQILLAVKKYFEDLGGEVVNCCTYGTIGSKSAIITACRGLGISSDIAKAITSLVKVERGFNWSLSDCYYGNDELNREPITEFKNIVDSYKGLWETAKMIEGIIISRGTHASGIFITNDKFEKYGAKMKSPDGTIVSQWDLHESEQYYLVKYDFLTISSLTKIRLTMDLLIANNRLEKKNTLKETYMSILNPHFISYNQPKIWDLIANNEVSDLFQFDSQVAMQTVSNIKPHSLVELAQTNSLMRLQAQEGKEETPTEMYIRYKNDINEWYKDMDSYEVPKKDREFLYEYLKQYNFVCDTQEAIMSLAMLPQLCCFSVKDAHSLRKIIAKKQKSKIPEMKKFFIKKGLENNVSINTLNYLWDSQIMLQAGYSFSILHCIAYTFIALQELILYTRYPSIYWNCACLTVNSGGTEESEKIYKEIGIEQKQKNTDYGRIAKAIGYMQKKGVKIALPDINFAQMEFEPNENTNEIMFGLKGVMKINNDTIKLIIENRPFKNVKDFYKRMILVKRKVTLSTGKKQNRSLVSDGQLITLIKAGAFDRIENISREQILENYLKLTNPYKKKLNAKSIMSIIELGIVPLEFKEEVRYFKFREYIKNNKKIQDKEVKSIKWHSLEAHSKNLTDYTINFFIDNFAYGMSENKDYKIDDNGIVWIALGTDRKGSFDSIYKDKVENLTEWLNSKECLDTYNDILFKNIKEENMSGNISRWEMESMNFYTEEAGHELANVNEKRYNIVDFKRLPERPIIIGYNTHKNIQYPKYELYKIAGTIVDKDKTKHIISILTSNDVVTVKFYPGQFAFYDKTISKGNDIDEKGKIKKTIIEESWFKRGNKCIITGFRRGDIFFPKRYKNSIYQHSFVLIQHIFKNGELKIKSERENINEI